MNFVNKKLQASKPNIKSITILYQSGIVYACLFLLIVCLYICVCECLLYNNNHQTKHKNNTNCGSVFEPGASGPPYYCTSICMRFGCTLRANCVDSKPKKKKYEQGHPFLIPSFHHIK